jgi:outer membrane protein TolC
MPKKSILLLIAVFSGLTGWAQDAMSLKDAVRIALSGNKAIAVSGASNDAASSRIAEAKSGFLPKVDYAESWTRSNNPVFVFGALLTQHQFAEQNFAIDPLNRPHFLNNFQSLVTADQTVFDAGKTKHAVRSARLAREITAEEARRTQMDVIAGVSRSYYDAQLSDGQLSSTDQALRSVQADLDRAEARLSAGMATDADVLSIRVHLAGVREERIRRTADLDVARASLNDALGLSLDAPHQLITSLAPIAMPEATLAEYEQNGAGTRPEAHQARIAKQLAEAGVSDSRGSYLPQVTLHGAFEADRQQFANLGGANWLVSIGLKWNLFNGFADKSKVEESQTALRRSSLEQERADSAIRLQVRRAWAELRAAQQRIESARAAETEAEESLRISQNRYEAGLSTVTDLLRVETAFLETKMRYLAAVHDERVAATMLEFAAGTLTADSEVLN